MNWNTLRWFGYGTLDAPFDTLQIQESEKSFFLNLICGRVILSVTRYLQDLHRHTTKRNETGAYDHMGCAVVILIDIIHIVSDLWEVIWSLFLFTLEVSQSEQREGEVRGTLVTGVFSVMALGHRYSESSCNAEAWPVVATWEGCNIPSQPAGSPRRKVLFLGGWGTANKPTLLCGRLDRAPQTLTTQGPYKDTKTDLTSDATGSC